MEEAVHNVRTPTTWICGPSLEPVYAQRHWLPRKDSAPSNQDPSLAQVIAISTTMWRNGSDFIDEKTRRGDLIQMFKFETGIEVINWHNQPLRIPPLYSHRERFHREVVRNCEPRHQFFNNRVTTLWNTLPDTVVQARTVSELKNRMDSYQKIHAFIL